jgi:pseudouridine-5'-phosphate glycosidase
MQVHPDVAAALAASEPVVALESTIVTHGLPRPDNLRVAREVEAVVRESGAVPATIAIVGGQPRIGLDDHVLQEIATRDDVVKCGVRDLAPVVARGGHGATTVASTALLAARVGIGVFATGGIGGVHRDAGESWDESSDLATLARTPIVVVCAGVKSILDVGATLERLETLNVTVLGYRSDAVAGFYLADSGHAAPWRVDSPDEVAAVMRARGELGLGAAILVANPLPADEQLDPELHDRVLAEGMAEAARSGVRSKDVTPFLLDRLHRETDGASLAANIRLIRRNAALAARIAAAAA